MASVSGFGATVCDHGQLTERIGLCGMAGWSACRTLHGWVVQGPTLTLCRIALDAHQSEFRFVTSEQGGRMA